MILIAGGSGSLGTLLVRRLAELDERVRILSRTPVRVPEFRTINSVEVMPGDLRDRAAVERGVAGARLVISAATGFGRRGVDPRAVDFLGNTNLIEAAEEHGVEHFILISVHGASRDHPLELFRMKHLAEQRLRQSTLSWTILRPTAFMETWIGIVGAPLLKKGKTVLFGRGQNPINFVSAHDVARFVEDAVTNPSLRGAAVDVGGPENLSLKQFVECFAAVTDAVGRVRHVPRPMLRAMSQLMRPIDPMIARLIRAAVVMDTADMTFDAAGLRRHFPEIQPTTLADAVRREIAGPPNAGA